MRWVCTLVVLFAAHSVSAECNTARTTGQIVSFADDGSFVYVTRDENDAMDGPSVTVESYAANGTLKKRKEGAAKKKYDAVSLTALPDVVRIKEGDEVVRFIVDGATLYQVRALDLSEDYYGPRTYRAELFEYPKSALYFLAVHSTAGGKRCSETVDRIVWMPKSWRDPKRHDAEVAYCQRDGQLGPPDGKMLECLGNIDAPEVLRDVLPRLARAPEQREEVEAAALGIVMFDNWRPLVANHHPEDAAFVRGVLTAAARTLRNGEARGPAADHPRRALLLPALRERCQGEPACVEELAASVTPDGAPAVDDCVLAECRRTVVGVAPTGEFVALREASEATFEGYDAAGQPVWIASLCVGKECEDHAWHEMHGTMTQKTLACFAGDPPLAKVRACLTKTATLTPLGSTAVTPPLSLVDKDLVSGTWKLARVRDVPPPTPRALQHPKSKLVFVALEGKTCARRPCVSVIWAARPSSN